MAEMMFCRLRRPVGRMTVVEQQLEGEFRYVNSRLITHRFLAIAIYFDKLIRCLSEWRFCTEVFCQTGTATNTL